MAAAHGSSKHRGLGRGLASLIPTAPDVDSLANDIGDADARESGSDALSPVAGARFAELPIDAITPNRAQPRQVFDQEAMDELVHSLREVGLLEPVIVRPAGNGVYELVAGERRFRAATQAGWATIPAIVRDTDDDDMLLHALFENLHRSQLNPLEEAAAYQQLIEDFACTQEELAQRVGRSRPVIANTIRLLKLAPKVQNRVAAGVLSAGHARALLGVEDADAQEKLAARIVAEGISVRGVEELVALGEYGGAEKAAKARRAKPSAPGLTDLQERLSERLETRVKIDLGRAKGKVTIEFANIGDLQRIVDIIDARNRRDRPI